MNTTLIISIVTITMALVFYTIGVWWERKSGNLTSAHVIIFWLGLLCDSVGTHMMSRLTQGGFTITLHTATGALALLLMAGHAIWATYTLTRGSESARQTFHRYSLIVWIIWLVPYLSGMVMGMSH